MSQISAAVLAAGTEQLALIAAICQRAYDSGAPWLGMPTVLFEHESKLPTDEFGSRNPALAGSTREQPVVHRVKRNGGRFLPGECHESNVTRQRRMVNGQPTGIPLEPPRIGSLELKDSNRGPLSREHQTAVASLPSRPRFER